MARHIGNIHYSQARGVQLRVDNDGEITASAKDGTPHSAVRFEAFALTDTVTDAQKLIDNMPAIAKAIHDVVYGILKVDGDG